MTGLSSLEVLGLARGASKRAIKRAYYRLSMVHHPDRYHGAAAKAEAQRKFVAVQSAYNRLMMNDDQTSTQHQQQRGQQQQQQQQRHRQHHEQPQPEHQQQPKRWLTNGQLMGAIWCLWACGIVVQWRRAQRAEEIVGASLQRTDAIASAYLSKARQGAMEKGFERQLDLLKKQIK